MTNKCLGCGVNLQAVDSNKEGFARDINKFLCERCFRIKNYNDYQVLPKSNSDFIPILETIGKTKDLVVLVIDILNIPQDLNFIKAYLNNDILLVFSKRDILPHDLWEERLLTVADTLNIKYIDKLLISSTRNYHLDELYEMINNYKKSNNVYVVGYTNAGKSSMINKIIYNYSEIKQELTTSLLPSTTLDTLAITINDNLTLIDTPGLIEEGNILDYISMDMIKKIASSKAINPLIYQVKGEQFFRVENFMSLTCKNNNIVFYLPNKLEVKRFYKAQETHNLHEYKFDIKEPMDVVIAGLGFVKITKRGTIKVYVPEFVRVYTRFPII